MQKFIAIVKSIELSKGKIWKKDVFHDNKITIKGKGMLFPLETFNPMMNSLQIIMCIILKAIFLEEHVINNYWIITICNTASIGKIFFGSIKLGSFKCFQAILKIIQYLLMMFTFGFHGNFLSFSLYSCRILIKFRIILPASKTNILRSTFELI